MKLRNGFVSNSSSSSFVISKYLLTEKQIYKIKNHFELSHKVLGKDYYPYKIREIDKWYIDEDENNNIRGHTYMDNFDMYAFFEKIGIDNSKVLWSEYFD